MEDINWQDPFKKESLEEASFESQITKNHSPSNSFANQFTGMRSRREEETFNGQNMQPTFSDRYSQAAQPKGSIPDDGFHSDAYQPRGSTSNEKEPIFEYNAMHRDDKKSSSAWRFLDLKNKKQTGDLYKKYCIITRRMVIKPLILSAAGAGKEFPLLLQIWLNMQILKQQKKKYW